MSGQARGRLKADRRREACGTQLEQRAEARGRINPMAAVGCIARRALYKHKQTADEVAWNSLWKPAQVSAADPGQPNIFRKL